VATNPSYSFFLQTTVPFADAKDLTRVRQISVGLGQLSSFSSGNCRVHSKTLLFIGFYSLI